MPDTPNPYAEAREHVAGVAAYLGLSAEQAERLAWRHEAAKVLNPQTGALAYLDGSQNTAAWLSNIERTHPTMLGKGVPSETAAAPTTSDASAVMQQARAGHISTDDAVSALFKQAAPVPATPATQTRTVSELMAAARKGVPGAQAALEARMRAF